MSSRVQSWNGFETTLNGAIDANTGTITVQSVDNLPTNTFLIIDPDVPAIRDFIFVTDINGVVLTVRTPRPEEGSTGGTAHAHSDGAVVRAVPVHQWLDLIFDDIEALEAFDAAHAPGTDPHPQYLQEGEADGLYLPLDGAVPMAADLQMGDNQVTGMAGGLTDTDGVNLLQMQNADAANLQAGKDYSDSLDHDHATPIASHATDAGAHHTKYNDTDLAASAIIIDLEARVAALEAGAPPEAHTHPGTDVTSAISVANVPNLPASKTTTGAFADARIPSLNASKTTAGTFDAARIPLLNANKITSGTFGVGNFTFPGLVGFGSIEVAGTVVFTGLAVNAAGVELRLNAGSLTKAS